MAEDQVVRVKGISTGALGLDIALGGQGIPSGRICELFGPEGSGKTTLALHVIASARRPAGWRPSSTPSTPWTPPGHASSAWTSRAC